MEPWLDRAAARRGFDAASGTDALAREIEIRLAERLQYVKLSPARIIDAASGAGASRAYLRAQYPAADVLSIDSSFQSLRNGRAPATWLRSLKGVFQTEREHWLAADMSRMPLVTASVDLLWSNLGLAWADNPLACFKEWHRVLSVGGLLMFTTYGPDTLKELRAAFADDPFPHIHPFIDMHDLGDMMMASGFAEPVMDMEMLTLTYADVPAVLADLRETGQTNAHLGRRRGLTGRRAWTQMQSRYGALRQGGRIPATFEIVYGHAWKPAPRETGDGRQIVHFKARPNSLP